MHLPADARVTRRGLRRLRDPLPTFHTGTCPRIWQLALLLAATVAITVTTHAAELPWAHVELMAKDSSRWPEVALVLRITDLDSYGGDSKTHDTSLPNPLNPFDCTSPDRPTPECWRIGLKTEGQDVQVLKQTTVLDPYRLRMQYLWLVYRAPGKQDALLPLDLSLARVMRKGTVLPVPLKEGTAHLTPHQAPTAEIADSPWPHMLAVAEREIRRVEEALPSSREREVLREQWASFTERDCQFQASAGIKHVQACRYDHIRAQLQALRQSSTRSAK